MALTGVVAGYAATALVQATQEAARVRGWHGGATRIGSANAVNGVATLTSAHSKAGTAIEAKFDSVAAAYQNAAAPASATAWSWSPDPPLTPMAPTTLPSRFSGMPPAKIMMRPLFDA